MPKRYCIYPRMDATPFSKYCTYPRRQTMRFVYRKQGQTVFLVERLEDGSHSLRLDGFRGHVQEHRWVCRLGGRFGGSCFDGQGFGIQGRNECLQNGPVLFFRLAAVDARGGNSLPVQGFRLVLHEGQEGTDDDRDASQQTGGQLITQRFSAPRGHDNHLRGSLHGASNGGRLEVGPQSLQRKDSFQDGLHLGVVLAANGIPASPNRGQKDVAVRKM